jgi:putative DNA primase/helicase
MPDDMEPKRVRVVRLDSRQFELPGDIDAPVTILSPVTAVVGTEVELSQITDAAAPKSSNPVAPEAVQPEPDGIVPKVTLRLVTQDGRALHEMEIGDGRGGGGGGSGGTPDEPPVAYSEDALANLLFDHIKDDCRYVATGARWYQWNGKLWVLDQKNAILPRARRICRATGKRLSKEQGAPSLARKVSAVNSARAAIEYARSEEPVAAVLGDFDADPWLLNTPYGIVDLKTGQLLPHDRTKMCSMISGAGPEGKCPHWHRFLGEITNSDRDYMDFLQRAVGYSLVGVVDEEVFLFLYGPANTGKSKFVETWRMVFANYAVTAPMDSFLPAKGERHPTDLAGFAGKRLITSAETETGRRWDRQRITMLTGRDRISARFMRGDFFEYDPTFLLVFHGNFRPGLDGSDDAMRRRARLLPFGCKPPQIDRHLIDKFRAELGGITAWAVEGCLLWQGHGLAPPKVVTEATNEYFDSQNSLGHWVEARCELGSVHDGDFWASERELYSDFQRAEQAEGVSYVMRQNQFIDQLVHAYALKRHRPHAGLRGVAGLRLKRNQGELPV